MKENNGFIIMDIIISLTLLVSIGSLLLFFCHSLSPLLISQKKIITQIESFRNEVIDRHEYNAQWDEIMLTTSSNITIRALVPRNGT